MYRGLGESHGEKDAWQQVGEKDMCSEMDNGSDMDSTYGEKDIGSDTYSEKEMY